MPSIHIGSVMGTLRKDIAIAAQDCSATGMGAYTGELSAAMLADYGVKWVILGHSERRTNQGESSALVATKTKQALDAGLSVMVCVGETLEEREAGRIDAVVLDDHMAALKGKFSEAEWARIAIAYEPVWAIGTGKTATPEQAQEVVARVESNLRRVSPESPRRPPRHRRDACSIPWLSVHHRSTHRCTRRSARGSPRTCRRPSRRRRASSTAAP